MIKHIRYDDKKTLCGLPASDDDQFAWRDERLESIVHRIEYLLGPGGVAYSACPDCVAKKS